MAAALVGWLMTGPAFAWVYPEHRDISVLAVQNLDPAGKAEFDGLWREARITHEPRLCEQGADAGQGLSPTCIDWAALAAIAGDHSCSSEDMLRIVLTSDWVLKVAGVAAQLKVDLTPIEVLPPAGQIPGDQSLTADLARRMESEKARAARINRLRRADTRLQHADPDYATRAGSNNAHFLLARPRTDTSVKDYANLTLRPGSEISAVGVYGLYHLSAMQKATRLAQEQFRPQERQTLVRSMLFDEAFALHFVQDIFSAGHVAGTWGDAAQRQGTHDFYNQSGLEVFTWQGGSRSMVLVGDAHLRPEDAERAAVAVRTSLEQILDIAAGRHRAADMPHTPAASLEPELFNVCKNNVLVRRPDGLRAPPEAFQLVAEVLLPTPVPSLGAGLGAMPRFRSEVGPFVGLASQIDGRYVNRGHTPSDGGGFIGGVDLSARVGVGLEGVTGESGDGLVFLSVGLRGESSSTNSIANPAIAEVGGNLAAAFPARMGLSFRLRMPYYLFPGDLLLLAPLYLIAPEHYTRMAVMAANGGLIGWQSAWATPIGRFQFVLGRELGVVWYGLIGEDRVLASSATPGGGAQVVDLQSIYLDVPFLEYKPFRAFATHVSSSVLLQVFGGVYIPRAGTVVSPAGSPPVSLDTVWSLGLRLVFDWRYFP